MRRPNRVAIVLVATLLVAAASSAQSSPSIADFAAKGFPDNSDLRGKLFAYVIGASRDVAVAYGEKQLQSAAGPVTVKVEKRATDFIVQFLNAGPGGAGEPGRGSCYIQRGNAKGNYILQARILLEDDPSCYLSLYPSGSGTRGDIVMYGALVKKGLYLSDMLYRILLLSFGDIVDATSRSFDWSGIFKFGPKGGEAEYLADLRSAEPRPDASAGPPQAEPAQVAKIALASSPALPTLAVQDLAAREAAAKAPRSQRIAAAIDRAPSPEALLLDLGASGETGAREISIAADGAPAFVDARSDPLAKAAYVDFPRYDARGLAVGALRAAIYLDLQANPGSVYALLGEGLRATVVPVYDDAGRLGFSIFSGGAELGWKDLYEAKRDAKVRIIRLPAQDSK